MDRKYRKDHRTRRDLHIQAGSVLSHISVCQHNTLAFSCCTGCEHDRTQTVRIRLICTASLMFGKKLSKRQRLSITLFFFHHDQMLYFGTTLSQDCCHIHADLVQHHGGHIRTTDQLTHFFCRKGHIQGHCYAAAVYCTKISYQPGIGSHTGNRHMSALLTQIHQCERKALAILFQLHIAFGLNLIFTCFITYCVTLSELFS